MKDENENELPEGAVRIPLDGTYGAGTEAEVTIYTRVGTDDVKEETYTVPFLAVDMSRLVGMNAMNLILGFKVLKHGKVSPLRELGL